MLNSTIATRAAEAMLRALGGSTLLLRVPAAGAASANPGLGVDAPVTEDITVAPAILRDAGTSAARAYEAVFPASALATYVEASGVENFLAAAHGIVLPLQSLQVEGETAAPQTRLLRIARVSLDRFAGQEYLVRLELRE